MMTVGSINGASFQGTNQNMQADSVSKNLQNQIANAQRQLQELSSKEGMTPEEKRKMRQEIQQEISNLNQQLRQHQIEMRKEQQTKKKDSVAKDLNSGSRRAGSAKISGEGSGLSQASMQAIISADSSMKQSQVQGSVATRMEGKARVLKSEIKQDASRGDSVEKKEEELADVQQRAQRAVSGQMSTLVSANQTMKDAAQTDADNRRDKAKEKTGDDHNHNDKPEDTASSVSQSDTYTPVDIRL